MKKLLITGGAGFIGRSLVPYLRRRHYQIEAPNSKELDITNTGDWSQWEKRGIGHLVHLAGRTFVPDSWEHPEGFFMANTLGTAEALAFCRRQKIGMTYISAYIYGQPKHTPIPETDAVQPNNPYAKSKQLAEDLCAFYCAQFDMDVTALRLFNVYGEGQSDKFLIPSIIIQALDEGGKGIFVQDLEPKRDYVYIEDVCRAIELSICNTKGYHVFNVGSGVSYSVREVVGMIQADVPTGKKILSKNQTRKNEIMDVVADITSIRQEWGWTPQVTIEAGLHRCIEEEKRYGRKDPHQ